MRRLSLMTIPILILGLASVPAQAEPIQITAGILTVNRTFGVFELEGPRDFALDAIYDGSPLSGVVVGPGDTVSLNMLGGVAGLVSIDGQTFQVHPVSGPPFASVNVLGSVVAPPFSNDQTVSVFAPFSFTGTITPLITSGGPQISSIGSCRARHSGGGIPQEPISSSLGTPDWCVSIRVL